jgi:hypothetical protein
MHDRAVVVALHVQQCSAPCGCTPLLLHIAGCVFWYCSMSTYVCAVLYYDSSMNAYVCAVLCGACVRGMSDERRVV